MLKTAPTYKVHVFILMAFFFGLTLGLTLNLVGSQTSTENRTRAESPGNQKNVYCRLTRQDLNEDSTQQDGDGWRVCNGNPGENGWLGQDDIDDNNPNDGTNNRTNIAIGNSVVLQYLSGSNGAVTNTNRTPQDTRCSVVQHDGLDSADDVWVQYSADASNYCVINYTPSKQNYCVQNGTRVNITRLQDEADYSGSSLNTWIKSQFDQKCAAAPSPTVAVPISATLNTTCAPNQQYNSSVDNNLSYKMSLTDMEPVNSDANVQFQFCMNPDTNEAHRYIYQYYFNSGANWKGPNGNTGTPEWACYKLAETTLNDSSYTGYWNSSVPLYGNTANNPKNIETLANFIKAVVELGEINMNLNSIRFVTKAVINVNGQKNDNIVAPQQIKIHPTACFTPTTAPTATPVPSNTPPVSTVCEPSKVATEVHTLNSGDYVANIINDNGDFTTKTHTMLLTRVDVSKPLKVVADWGWTGRIGAPKPQKGKVNLPGQSIEADEYWQRNEASKVTVSAIKPGNALRSLLNLTCNDIGEFLANVNQTPFVDGRKVSSGGTLRNLQDIYPDETGEQQGDYFFCPQTANAGWPVTVANPRNRPSYQFSSVNLAPEDYFNTNIKTVRLQVKRQFLGLSSRTDDAVESTDNARTAGSHYTRVTVQYCKL